MRSSRFRPPPRHPARRPDAQLGKLDIAEACYLGALRHKNDFPMALYGLGEVHTQAEDRDDLAEAAYRLAIENWPEYVDAYIALGDLH